MTPILVNANKGIKPIAVVIERSYEILLYFWTSVDDKYKLTRTQETPLSQFEIFALVVEYFL